MFGIKYSDARKIKYSEYDKLCNEKYANHQFRDKLNYYNNSETTSGPKNARSYNARTKCITSKRIRGMGKKSGAECILCTRTRVHKL